MLDTVAALQEVPLFSGLSRVELAKLLPELEELRLEPGETLFHRGDVGDALYIVRGGRIEIEVPGKGGVDAVRLAVLGPGDSVGEFALLTGEPRTGTARALEAVDVWRLGKERFDHLVTHNPRVALFLTHLLVHRLVATNDDLTRARAELVRGAAERFARLPADVQAFALRTCVLDRIRPAVLCRLEGCQQAEEYVRLLASEGLAQPVTSDGAWRLPDYFREFLASRVQHEGGPQTLRRLRLDIAAHHERLGDVAAAVDMYLQSEEWEAAGRLLARHARRFAADNPRRFVAWLAQLAEHGWRDGPELLELGGTTAQRLDNSDAAVKFYEMALATPDVEADAEHTARLCQTLAEVYLARGDAAQAISYMRLAGLEGGGGDNGGVAQFQDSMVGRLLRLGHRDAAVQWARKALLTRRDTRDRGLLSILLGPNRTRVAGAVLAVAVPLLIALSPVPANFTYQAWLTFGFLIGAAFLWLFNVIPDFVVGLGLVVACIIFGATDPATAMSGFSSQTYFVTLGVLALGASMLRTGITYRLSLHMLRRFPPYYVWQVVGMAVAGVLLTPVIPLAMGRIAIASPLALTIADALRLGDRSKGSTGLAMATFLGFGTMYFLFFNGPGALLILGLLPPGRDWGLDFGTWLLWSLPIAATLFFGTLAAILILYPARAAGTISPETIRQQLAVLGPVTRQERLMVAVVGVALVWFIFQPFDISPAWIMLVLVGVMIVGGVLDRNELRQSIDWPQLLYTATMLGFAAIAGKSGLNNAIGAYLVPMIEPLSNNPYTFLGALVVANFALRFLLPGSPVFVLMLLSFIPLASRLDYHPFVIAQLVNVAINIFVMPQQSQVYQTLFSATEERAFSYEGARPIALLHPVLTLLGVLASVPFWQALGLIK